MIPKIIHYCWFGGKKKPKLARKCIKSWGKYCKGYKFIEWNESNFSIDNAPLYVRQAYKSKKFAFVTDYVRLYALIKYGGIYMDTDVEVLKPLDIFLSLEAFSGFESLMCVPTGIMASVKKFPLFEKFLQMYNKMSFYDKNGNPTYITNVTLITKICKSYGLKLNNTKQTIEGFTLFPSDYFCPFSYETKTLNRTKNSYTIHWFSGSWVPKNKLRKIKKIVKFILGEKISIWLKRNVLRK